ncbi:hypothetical protein P691DRAFT_766571 [Macrolepiota fuliginosa MF-IS2]|uniref:Uncharacterized protein n=1 Tax=Macrolepiota fuliginosa MF-IS2 TaxID=1400762 RepID=A0A9P5X0A2_9AGAR|nr:hypothetical protein P691DRAFT_766571 [Macrolepiota fuliginosa MF-IS2]
MGEPELSVDFTTNKVVLQDVACDRCNAVIQKGGFHGPVWSKATGAVVHMCHACYDHYEKHVDKDEKMTKLQDEEMHTQTQPQDQQALLVLGVSGPNSLPPAGQYMYVLMQNGQHGYMHAIPNAPSTIGVPFVPNGQGLVQSNLALSTIAPAGGFLWVPSQSMLSGMMHPPPTIPQSLNKKAVRSVMARAMHEECLGHRSSGGWVTALSAEMSSLTTSTKPSKGYTGAHN